MSFQDCTELNNYGRLWLESITNENEVSNLKKIKGASLLSLPSKNKKFDMIFVCQSLSGGIVLGVSKV